MPFLEVRELRKEFRNPSVIERRWNRFFAVDRVSFSLERGKILCVVGESGSGKSTLCLLILRICTPDSGEVILGGRDILRLPAAQMRHVRKSMQPVFQDPMSSLNPRQRIVSIIEEPIRIHVPAGRTARRDKVAEVVDRVGLGTSILERYPHELSAGQRQRVALARALACAPELLILDEPVSNLDTSVQGQIVNLVKTCQDDLGVTVLFVSHELRVVRQLADTVCVMYRGRFVEMAEADSFFQGPLHPYSRALLDAEGAGRPGDRPRTAEGFLTVGKGKTAGCPFAPNCPEVQDGCEQFKHQLKRLKDSHYVSCMRY